MARLLRRKKFKIRFRPKREYKEESAPKWIDELYKKTLKGNKVDPFAELGEEHTKFYEFWRKR
jgi:hypothetical protein